MLSKARLNVVRYRSVIIILCLGFSASLQLACSAVGIGTETAYVISERLELRSTTAKVFRSVGQLKNGDRVTIVERAEQDGRSWARLRGPNGESGWSDVRFLVSEDIVEQLKDLAEGIKDIPVQATGQPKKALNLRLTPDRSTEDNVITRLPEGTTLEIIEIERKPRPANLESKSSVIAEDDNEEKDTEQKTDQWFKVRVKDNQVLPAGWAYAGSLQLDIPDEIYYHVSGGYEITGWQKIGTITDSGGRSGGAWFVFEKELYPDNKDKGVDKSGNEDFSRVKVISWDPGTRNAFTPFRIDLRGKFPVTLKMDGNRGQFQLKELDKSNSLQTRDGSVDLSSDGKVTITGLKASESQPKPKK